MTNIRRISSLAFSLAALSLLAIAILWPGWAETALHSRLAIAFTALCFGATIFFLHPELNSGLRHGITEFRNAMKDLASQCGNDDDDPPQPA
jgi:hypothetical protein